MDNIRISLEKDSHYIHPADKVVLHISTRDVKKHRDADFILGDFSYPS